MELTPEELDRIQELAKAPLVAHLQQMENQKQSAEMMKEIMAPQPGGIMRIPAKPKTTHILLAIGGQWIEWNAYDIRNEPGPPNVHGVKFDNGWIWDSANGWRGEYDKY